MEYAEAMFELALSLSERPNFNPQNGQSIEAQEYARRKELVSEWAARLNQAVGNLPKGRAEKLLSIWKDAKQRAIRLEEELPYAELWDLSRAHQTTATYQAVCALQNILEPAYKHVRNCELSIQPHACACC